MDEAILSSCWCVGRFERFRDFAQAAKGAGFSWVELHYELSPTMLGEYVETRPFPVVSLHNPCPARQVRNGVWSHDLPLSALEEEARQHALALAKGTVNIAATIGARAVVLHVGVVPQASEAERALRQLYDAGRAQTPEYAQTKERLAQLRAAHAEPYVEASLRSLHELSRHARERGIRLGQETRYHLDEIPNPEELALFLGELPADAVGYWHDVGHAETQARLGFAEHRSWLERFRERLIGCHLHDIVGLGDHRAAGTGDQPWGTIASLLPQGILRVCEFGGFNEPQEVASGLRFLRDQGIVS